MVRVRRFRYSVSEGDVERFVAANGCVRDFLSKYAENKGTFYEKATGLARFFRWLQIVKGLDITPSVFLNTHLKKRSGSTVEDRRWALQLALEYSRDNPNLKGKAAHYVYSAFFLPVKIFCDYHEAPLTSTNGFFPGRGRRKYKDKPFTVEFVKRLLALLSQRDRAICMAQIQSGQAISQILVDVNEQGKRIFQEIDAGRKRIRLDFAERKGNNFPYFSFISVDAIQEIQKWRIERAQLLRKLGTDSPYLFITDSGQPLPPKQFHNNLRLMLIRHKLYSGPLSVRSHGFRKFFEQESSPPDRGVSRSYVSFMMGHSNGTGQDHRLDVVGGVYDPTPRVYPDVVENEYAKLEPYLNIYSNPHNQPATDEIISDEDMDTLRELLEEMKKGNVIIKRDN